MIHIIFKHMGDFLFYTKQENLFALKKQEPQVQRCGLAPSCPSLSVCLIFLLCQVCL